jgi:hypothetical protein
MSGLISLLVVIITLTVFIEMVSTEQEGKHFSVRQKALCFHVGSHTLYLHLWMFVSLLVLVHWNHLPYFMSVLLLCLGFHNFWQEDSLRLVE